MQLHVEHVLTRYKSRNETGEEGDGVPESASVAGLTQIYLYLEKGHRPKGDFRVAATAPVRETVFTFLGSASCCRAQNHTVKLLGPSQFREKIARDVQNALRKKVSHAYKHFSFYFLGVQYSSHRTCIMCVCFEASHRRYGDPWVEKWLVLDNSSSWRRGEEVACCRRAEPPVAA